MSVEEESGELIFQEREIDYAQLHVHLHQLVDCYNSALAYINRPDRCTGNIQEISIPVDQQENRDLIDNKLATAPALKKKLMMIRFLIRWHAEDHIRSRLLAISRNRRLLVERLNDSSPENSDSKDKFFAYLENVERYAQELIHWGRIKSTFLRIFGFLPIVLTLFAIFFPSLRVYEGIQLPRLLEIIIDGLNRDDVSTMGNVLLGLNILWAVTVLLQVIIIEFGFDVKRAIFTGGLVREKSVGRDEIEMTFLQRSPARNIYHLENEIFDFLGSNKPKEIPYDLLINLYIILLLWSLLGFSYLYNLDRVSSFELVPLSAFRCWLMVIVGLGIYVSLFIYFKLSDRMKNGDM